MLSLFRKNKPLTGHLQSPPDRRDRSFGAIGVGVSSALTEEVSLSQWEPQIFGQLGNTCVAESIAACNYILEAQAGLKPILISRHGLYSESCAQHDNHKRLRDDGTYPRTAIKVASKIGIAPESAWPHTLTTLRKRVPDHIRMLSHGGRGMQYAFINSVGERRVEECIKSLKAGYAFCPAMKIDRAFGDDMGPHFIRSIPGNFIGGHQLTATGARVGPEGPEFKLRNSYWARWRLGGYVWVSWRVIASPFCTEITVPYGTDRVRNVRPNFNL